MRYTPATSPSSADERRVREVAVEGRRPDERDDLGARASDLVDRRAGRADESRPEQEVLGRVAGDRELGEHDEIGRRAAGFGDRTRDPLDVAVEIADDDVQLGERESHRVASFRLTITNLDSSDSGSGVPAEDHRRLALVPEDRERRRVEAVEPPVRDRLPEPAGGERAEAVRVADEEDVSGGRTRTIDHAVDAGARRPRPSRRRGSDGSRPSSRGRARGSSRS